ncbi:MAG: tRNA (adenosine(37)-N6)-dimethylallyltransferase MiaA [Planctomycetota bacterium]
MAQLKTILILGPTAGGKSDLAVDLAERLPSGGEVVGADAFQVYRHLDAGTAKPDRTLRGRVPHHLIDIVEPTERFTVHQWLERAHKAIEDIQSRGRRPIIVGGTNLYMKALLDGMFDGPGQDPAFRASLDLIQTPALHHRLREVDPDSADRLKPADRQRIVRALEVFELTSTPISSLQTQWAGGASQGLDADLVGLRWETEAINQRINLRVKAMFYPDKVDPEIAAAVCINRESLIDEVARLKGEGWFQPVHAYAERSQASGISPNQAREALGYKQLLAWMERTDEKLTSIEEVFERTKVLTRRFAKQQRTWLKRFVGTHWVDGERYKASRDETLVELVQAFSEA